jgi:hypothetical protein
VHDRAAEERQSVAVSPGMVKFLLLHAVKRASPAQILRCANHVARAERCSPQRTSRGIFKILSKFDLVKFDEKSRRIRIDIAQKRRFIANDNFNAVCYCLL